MAKRHGLGKGLGALIPETIEEFKESNKEDVSIKKEEEKPTSKISLNLIKPNPEQPRKNFDEEKIKELSLSIKENGIIQPLILKKVDNSTYLIIAGERRWRAARLANMKEVPAVVLEDVKDKEILKLSLIENIQREDLNPIEEAIAYEKLIVELKLTQEELSEKLGKSRTSITNCLRLLNLDKRVQEYLVDGVISEGHGRALLALKNKDIQYKIAQEIIDKGLSVRGVEYLVKELSKEKKEGKRLNDTNSPFMKDIENRLRDYFGTKVSLNNTGKDKGKIQIEYYSNQDLQRIMEILKL
ncbi:ParB/RepB/Spo0J family partition protein [Hathewaya histolytica]|uniref:Spo0J n=1 Tax=Hathewaya histolytica TaxID=1498 RepID=A0A4U9RVY5_HATHI|nr:ParB/RepB/Spo0J family partition protein [Hathewaya histolytica]VTQ96605.1 spo0J [Hathewaya histolytica]